jgi:hypothetical protein
MEPVQNQLFIDGEFVDSEARSRIPVLNPHDNSLITEVAEAQKADIDRAVEAARKAFPAWAKLAAADRGRLLLKLADAIEARSDELATLESIDTGHPLRDTRGLDVVRTAFTFRYFGGMADKVQGSVVPVEQGFLNYVLRQPLGVVGQAEDVDRRPVVVEVTPNPGKGSGPVLDGVSADADLRVGERDDAALEERVFHHREVHAAPPGPGKVSELWHGHRGLPIATRIIGMIDHRGRGACC